METYAGLTLEEIAITHKDNELVKALVKKIVDQKKEIVDLNHKLLLHDISLF